MPPVRKDQQEAVRKRVEFVAKDDEEQVATGVVMVPDKVDLQGDFTREEQIRAFADQFGNFVEVDEADGGVMHAAWPAEWMDLERNAVLDEAADIGGQTVDAGSWVQDWAFNDGELWDLVADDVISGFSIGADAVEWRGPLDPEEVEDVAIPEEHDDDAPIWEIVNGIIREVSAVDIPAVPDAQILETKSAYEKRLADHLGNRDGFIEEAVERGHSETEAERLWDVLNRAVDVEGAGEPGKQSFFERVGKTVVTALKGDETNRDPEPTAKEGRTLSAQNRDDLKAVMDAAASIFRDAGNDPGFTRFTDREEDSFDLSDHTARTFAAPDDEDDEEQGNPLDFAADTNDADPDGGNQSGPDDDMSDDSNPMDDAPDWAKAIADQVEQNTEQIDEYLGKDADDPFEDAPEWAKSLAENVEENAESIEQIATQGGHSQQLGGGDEPEKGGEPEDFGDAFGKEILGQASRQKLAQINGGRQ